MSDLFRRSAVGSPDQESDEAIRALADWLRRDPDTRTLDVSFAGAPEPTGTMSGAGEVINVVLTHTEALANVLIAYAAWRHTRRDPPVIMIERGGYTITVPDGSPQTLDRALRALRTPEAEGREDAPS